jgi:hypothetical protein
MDSADARTIARVAGASRARPIDECEIRRAQAAPDGADTGLSRSCLTLMS